MHAVFMTFHDYDFSYSQSFSWMNAAVSDRKEHYALSCRLFYMRAWSSMTTGNYVSMTIELAVLILMIYNHFPEIEDQTQQAF